jgi:hypothetical protein
MNALAPGVCMLLLLVGASSGAEQDAGEMAEMRALVEDLRNRVDAQAEQLEHQGEIIEQARVREEREASSGLSPFLSSIEIGGWVAASWFWNFNDPDDGAIGNENTGSSGNFYPFHPDHNSFALDQLWFELEKPVSEESPAGFRVDIAYGKTAGLISAATGISRGQRDDSDIYLNQAYIQYLTPVGLTLRAGKFGTLLGAEVAQTVYNFNVTRGNVYNLLQPIDHIGVIVDGASGPFSYSLGVVNDSAPSDPDTNDAKHILAGLSYGGENYSLGTSILWGPEAMGNSSQEAMTIDVLSSWDPCESVSTWLNFDYKWGNGFGAGDPKGWGIALAGRWAFAENWGFALRTEFLQDENGLFGLGAEENDVFGVTGTLDYSITDNLVVKAEARYDLVDKHGGEPDEEFIDDERPAGFTRKDQVVGGLELVYKF